MNETLADVMRQAGIRPAWEGLAKERPARPGLNRGGHGALPYQRPAMQAMATRDIEQSLGGGESSRNQLENTAQGALEMTGLPSVRRSARAFASGDPATGFLQGGLGALGVAGMAAGVPRRMPVARSVAMETPPARLPVNPARPIGRATDGSVMPVAPSAPFRNSLRGGGDDLMDATRRATPALNPSLTVFHGARRPVIGALRPGADGVIWSTTDADAATFLATRRGRDGANIIRGKIAPENYAIHDSGGFAMSPQQKQQVIAQARADGRRGVVFINDIDGVANARPAVNIASFGDHLK